MYIAWVTVNNTHRSSRCEIGISSWCGFTATMLYEYHVLIEWWLHLSMHTTKSTLNVFNGITLHYCQHIWSLNCASTSIDFTITSNPLAPARRCVECVEKGFVAGYIYICVTGMCLLDYCLCSWNFNSLTRKAYVPIDLNVPSCRKQGIQN